MKQDKKIHGILKKFEEDFVVEEVSDSHIMKVSSQFIPSKKPDVSHLVDEKKEFLRCVLEKKGIDHFTAIKDIARALHKSDKAIGYAGTKDKAAHTAQNISIHKPDISLLKEFSHPHIILKEFSWDTKKIKLGNLEANRFTITIRDCDKKDAIKMANTIRKTSFFPNFFGEQRFGSQRKNNAVIGKLIIKRRFADAINEILTGSSPSESLLVREARNKLRKNGDYKEALHYFPQNLRLERQLLLYLSQNPKGYVGALKYAHRKNILMFVHALQSKLFNEILEQALEEDLDFTKKGQENVPLVGYKVKFSQERLGKIEKQVMKKNGVEKEDFDLREIPFLRIKGQYRKALISVKDIDVAISDDEEYKSAKKMVISFTLPKGAYATTYLDQFFYFPR